MQIHGGFNNPLCYIINNYDTGTDYYKYFYSTVFHHNPFYLTYVILNIIEAVQQPLIRLSHTIDYMFNDLFYI